MMTRQRIGLEMHGQDNKVHHPTKHEKIKTSNA